MKRPPAPIECPKCGRLTRSKHIAADRYDVTTVSRGRGGLCQACTSHADGKFSPRKSHVPTGTPDPATLAGLNRFLAQRHQRLNAGSVAKK